MIAINQAKRAVGAISADFKHSRGRGVEVGDKEREKEWEKSDGKAKPLNCRHVSKQTYQRQQLAVV